ncbi:MAG: hypothetical protein HY460_02095 [Parcubacteria group bacterium]|nr:hypothetical protein [Parcubacteria group bacterium]
MDQKTKSRIAWLFAAGAILLVHASYIANGFTWLDHGDIEGKRAVVSLAELPKTFVARYGETGYYRPLVTTVHSINATLFGGHAWGFHLVNILLHAAVSVAAAFFINCFIRLAWREKILASLIVGVHSANWFTVGTISNVQELLVVLWTMLSVTSYAAWRERQSKVGIVLALIFFALALFSKETAIGWVPLLLVWYEIVRKGSLAAGWKNLTAWWSVLALTVAGYVALHIYSVTEVWRSGIPALSLPEAIGTRLEAIGLLLIRLVNPFKAPASDATAVHVLSIPGAIALAAILLAGYYLIRHRLKTEQGAAIGLLAIMLAPALNIVPLPRFIAPHYAYFPVVGAAAGIVLLLRRATRSRINTPARACIAAWLAIMAGVTFLAGSRFKNDLTLFQPEVERDPRYLEGRFYLGNFYSYSGDFVQAAHEYEAALLPPADVLAFVDSSLVRINYAGVLFAQGKLDDADALLAQLSGTLSPSDQENVDYNRALIAYKKGDRAQAILLLKERQWTRPEPYLLLIAVEQELQAGEE